MARPRPATTDKPANTRASRMANLLADTGYSVGWDPDRTRIPDSEKDRRRAWTEAFPSGFLGGPDRVRRRPRTAHRGAQPPEGGADRPDPCIRLKQQRKPVEPGTTDRGLVVGG